MRLASTGSEPPKEAPSRVSIEQLDCFRPIPTRDRGAGSDESRKAHKDALYQLAVRRLTAHLTKADLEGLLQELKLAGRLAMYLRKSEMIDLIAIEHWGLEPPAESLNAWEALKRAIGKGHREKRDLESLNLPEMRHTPGLLDSIARTTGGYIELSDKGEHRKLFFAPAHGRQGIEAMQRLVLLAVNKDYRASRRPCVQLWRFRDTPLAQVPFAHRRPFPWDWGRPRFATRFQCTRDETCLSPATQADQPSEITSDIALVHRVWRAMTGPGLDPTEWAGRLAVGYLCHLPSPADRLAVEHLPKPTMNHLDRPSELSPHFLPDLPLRSAALNGVQMNETGTRQLIYRLTRLGEKTEEYELPQRNFALKLTEMVREDTAWSFDDAWSVRVEETVDVDIYTPQWPMDARMTLSKEHKIDPDLPWLANLMEACTSGNPPLGLSSPQTPIDERVGHWTFESDSVNRYGHRVTTDGEPSDGTLITDTLRRDGTRTMSYEIRARSTKFDVLTKMMQGLETDVNGNITNTDEAPVHEST